MTTLCPCCKRPLDGLENRVLVDPGSNTVTYKDKQVRLVNQEFDIVHALAIAYPKEVRHELLINAVWGGLCTKYHGEGELTDPLNSLATVACKARKSIRDMDFTIENIWGRSYRIVT